MTGTRAPLSIVDLFDRACAAHSDAIALEIPAGIGRARVMLTYQELDTHSRAIATMLAQHAARDAVVALALPRTDARLYAAMLGIMRAGSAYCAIDPAFPNALCAQIVRDADAVALIADDERAHSILHEGASCPVFNTRDIDAARANASTSACVIDPMISLMISPSSLAYVIYTSGTTGAPKGVEVEHCSIFNLVASDLAEFGLTRGDRVVQGSSASYDSSIEEIWLAWAAGATALVMDDETARLGPDLLTWLQDERVTVLCPPPTLLRTLDCADPARELPLLRLLYVGGEALPTDLADQWSQGRRLENGYGPTECTVTCLRSTVHHGEPVTIGRAIANSHAWVVDPDHAELPEILDQMQGELVIGGISLARGYRGQAATTASRFIMHPTLGRVYRTGDLVHRDQRGQFHYHGRIDAQVKLRGYRVELGAVEARLAAHPLVREAACTIEGEGAQRKLVAHVVTRDELELTTPRPELDVEDLRAFVALELPSYMVPTLVARIEAIPRSVGGKIDRKQLPAILDANSTQAHNATNAGHVAPANDTERAVAAAIASALGRSGAISVTDDFFDDLSLNSLTIAISISRMRLNDATRAATVRLAYEHRSVRAMADALLFLAQRARTIDAPALGESTPHTQSRTTAAHTIEGVARPKLATAMQSAFLLLLLLASSQLLWIPHAGSFLGETIQTGVVGAVLVAALSVASFALYALLVTLLLVATKWILIGRYRAKCVRAWSFWHVRHWMVTRVSAMVPWEIFEALGLAPVLLRALGARIGARVHIHRGVRLTDGGWDLITLEDDATLGQDASLRIIELEAGCLVLAPIIMRRGSTLETRAGLSPGAELGTHSIVRALSNLGRGTREDHSILDGIPATRLTKAPAIAVVDAPRSEWLRLPCAILLIGVIMMALLLPWGIALELCGLRLDSSMQQWLFRSESSLFPSLRGLALLALATVAASIATVFIQTLLVRALGKAPRGAFSLSSFASLRMAMQAAMVEAAGKWLSGTILWPMWLNLAGARIGRGCEISTVTGVVPSTIHIGAETFFADGIYLGGPSLHAGTASIEPVVLGESCFIGNHAVLPAGTRIARETLVGISTRGDGLPDESGSSWFGHPLFRLPRREIVEAAREVTHDPSSLRRINRWCWELARFLLPIGPLFVALVWYRVMELAEQSLSMLTFRLIALPLGVLCAFMILASAVLALKWMLVGRVKPGQHPLWSCWCSRWDFLYVAWGMWAAVPLTFLEGTLLLVMYLRLMGCRIGRRALLGSGFSHVVDPDMLHFGDDVSVQALFQAHTFEDRVLKIDHVHIRDGATVGANTVLLYGADVGERTIVAPHSVVMKREVLLSDSVYEGVPTQAVNTRG